MEIAWIGVIGTVVGGILVGVVSWLQKRQELDYFRKQEDRKLLRDKIEQLHTMFLLGFDLRRFKSIS